MSNDARFLPKPGLKRCLTTDVRELVLTVFGAIRGRSRLILWLAFVLSYSDRNAVEELQSEARRFGYSKFQLHHAARLLGVKRHKYHYGGGSYWTWKLPPRLRTKGFDLMLEEMETLFERAIKCKETTEKQ
jgi:hypothetical protein